MVRPAVHREHLPDHLRDVPCRRVAFHARDPRHHVRLCYGLRLARQRLQVKHLVPQPRLAPGEPAPHGLDQVEDVVRGGPTLAAVVDRHRERRGQQPSGCQLPAASLCADERVVGEGDVAEGPYRQVTLGSRLELDREKQVPRASAEVDLPQHVGLGADQAGGSLFGGQVLGPLEVQLAGEVAVDEAADHVLDGQRQGEEELVGLVVSAGQRGSPAVVGSAGAGGSDSRRSRLPAVASVRSQRCRGVPMAGWDCRPPGDDRCVEECREYMT